MKEWHKKSLYHYIQRERVKVTPQENFTKLYHELLSPEKLLNSISTQKKLIDSVTRLALRLLFTLLVLTEGLL